MPARRRWKLSGASSGSAAAISPAPGRCMAAPNFIFGPMALVSDEASGVSAVLASKRIQANDKEMFRHVGVEPAEVPILGLKSTVHFRADFQPIAQAILCVNS